MYKGKRVRKRDRSFLLLASLVLVVALGVGASVAYLIDNTNEVKNTFTPASVPPQVTESFDGEVKKDVQVKNTGNVSAYIRALINVTWQDAQGKIAPEVPAFGVDYNMVYGQGKWVESGDYWYYTEAVVPGGLTDNLITKATQLQTNGDYKLVIEIVSQTIQSEGKDSTGKTPVELAWGAEAAKIVGAIEEEG